MKKSFYFALALTAGLFASCSSDDLSQAPGTDFAVNDAEDAVITIGVDGIQGYGTTRGTGSILGKTWGGQQFELFMFKKGTFDPATYQAVEGGPELNIFNNDTLTTGKGDSKAAYIVGGAEQFQYFPSTGSYDFWAYRADDAGGAPAVDASGNVYQVPFEINGTQDLMIAVTDTAKAAQSLKAKEPSKFADEDAALEKIYSAYSARRGVNPKLKFSHLLTRLTFEVKAATRDVSTAATAKTTDLNEKLGFTITKVTVWSKSKGNINVAYKAGIPADAERIEWDAAELWNDTTTLADFQLMSRDQEIEKADIKMINVNKNAVDASAIAVPDHYTLVNATFDAATPCYISGELNATTGELIAANATTFGIARADAGIASVWVPAIHDGDHGDGDATATPVVPATPWDKHIVKEDPSAKLKPLVPVVPEWEGFNNAAGWSELTKTATAYTWTPVAEADLANAPYNKDAAAVTALKAAAAASAPTPTTTGAVNDVYCHNNLGVYEFYGLTAIVYNTATAVDYDAYTNYPGAGATNPKDDNVAGVNDGDIVYVAATDKYYSYHIAGTIASQGQAVATPVGESVLVAPADDNGYWVEFTYTRTKKITDSHVEPMVGTGLINVKTAAGKSFVAGKTYKVTAILYSDGEIKVDEILDTDGDGPVEDYTDGSGDLDDGNDGNGYGIE